MRAGQLTLSHLPMDPRHDILNDGKTLSLTGKAFLNPYNCGLRYKDTARLALSLPTPRLPQD